MSTFREFLRRQQVMITRSLSSSSGAPHDVAKSVRPTKREWIGLKRLGIVGSTVGGYAGYVYAWREGWFNFRRELEHKKKLVVLGSGWSSVALMRHIDHKLYDVTCVSPRNYFLMTVGDQETKIAVNFLEAECIDIDPTSKKITCQSGVIENEKSSESQFSGRDAADNRGGSSSRRVQDGARTRPAFDLDYDLLVVAIGADNNTFNTPGVDVHAHFLKELPDARRIRAAISDCFESAVLPSQTPEERERLLTFVVVGGGPTGVEFAAELSDMVQDDVKKNFPLLKPKDVKIALVEALDQILSMYDAKISDFTEHHFARENITVMKNTFVKEVQQTKVITQQKGSSQKDVLPCGMVVWATGIKNRPLVALLRQKVGSLQSNPRALLTDTHLRVKGAPEIFALGDCSSIEMPKLSANFASIVPVNVTELSFDEFRDLIKTHKTDFPQLQGYADQMRASFEKADLNKDGKLQMHELKMLLEDADRSCRPLPATAQVANQEGRYLANLLNKVADKEEDVAVTNEGPFRYRHFGSLAYVGGDNAVIDFSGTGKVFHTFGLEPLSGRGAFYLWRSFYLSEMVTLRTKILLTFDWLRSKLFGRDISRV